MRRPTGRETLLLALMVAFGLVYLWYASSRSSTTGGGELAAGEGGGRLAARAPIVPLELLTPAAEEYGHGGRDLFKYSARPPSPAEVEAQRQAELAAQRAREAAERDRQERARVAAEQQARAAELAANAPPPPPPEPTPPGIPFRYIGYLGPPADRIAVLQDGEELLLARRGEPLRGSFKVVEIRYESVVMGYTDPRFEDRTREIPMGRK
jgi:hypothetical protein